MTAARSETPAVPALPQLTLRRLAPHLARLFPFAADFDLGTLFGWLEEHDAQSREHTPSPVFLLRELRRGLTEQSLVGAPEHPPQAMDLGKLQLYVFPILLHMAPADTQLEWLTTPTDPKWGPPLERALLERLICNHLHAVGHGDPRHTLAAAQQVGGHMALLHHRAKFGPTPEDFARSAALRRLALEELERSMSARSVSAPSRRTQDLQALGLSLIQGWERLLLAEPTTGPTTPDALDAESGMERLWRLGHHSHRLHILRLRLPVLPPAMHRLWQTAVTDACRPKLEQPRAGDIKVVVTGISARPTLLHLDGADRWQQWLSHEPSMDSSIREALMNLLACGWQLVDGETVRTLPRGWHDTTSTEEHLPPRIPFDATWAPVLAQLRAHATADPTWVWSLEKVEPAQRRLTLRRLGTEDPALLGERVAVLWDSGWQAEVETFLLSAACPSDRPVMWRSLLLHRDPRLRLLATRALGESIRSGAEVDPAPDGPTPIAADMPDALRAAPRR